MSGTETLAPTLPIHTIQSHVAERFGIEVEQLLGDSRSPTYALPRQVAMFLAVELTTYSSSRIGRAFNRDRTTVLLSCDTVKAKCRADEALGHKVAALKVALRERMPAGRLSRQAAARGLIAAASVAVEGGNQAIFERLAAVATRDPGRVIQELDHLARRLEREIGQ